MAVFQDKRGRWCCDWYDPSSGRRHRRVFSSKDEATHADRQLRASARLQKSRSDYLKTFPTRPLGPTILEFLSLPHRQRHGWALRPLSDHLGPATPLHTITADHLDHFLDGLRFRLQPSTVNLRRVYLVAFFRWCVARGFLPHSPHTAMRPRLRYTGPKVLLPRPEHVVQLATTAAPLLRRAILLAAHAGLRVGEIVRATDLDIAAGFLHVRPLKNGNPHSVYLSPELTADLQLPPTTGNLVPLTRSALIHAMRAHTRKLSLPPYRIHDLRHYACTQLARNGASELLLMEFLGHKSTVVTRHYVHLGAVEVTRALMKLHGVTKGA